MTGRGVWWWAVLVVAVGCGGNPVAPNDEVSALVSALDGLSRDCNQEGDADGSLAFTYASMALRSGVMPVPLTLQVSDRDQAFKGFVHVVRHGTQATARELRTLLAFRPRSDSDPRPGQVLYIGVPVDSAGLGTGPSPSVQVGHAVWKDLTTGETWVATLGKAGIATVTSGGACPGAAWANVTCSLGTFSAFVDGDFRRRHSGAIDPEPVFGIRGRTASIDGATILFSD